MVQAFGARYTLASKGGQSYEPVREHDWEVSIGGVGQNVALIPLVAQSVHIPTLKGEKGTIKHINEVTNYLLRPEPVEISMKILDVINPNSYTAVWNWYNLGYGVNDLATGPGEGATMGFAADYKTQIVITQFDLALNPVRIWTGYGAFLLDTPEEEELNYENSKALMATLRISVDRIGMVAVQ